jgi:uncharacterized protein
MPEYLTPGVYYERVDASPPTISALRTDVTGFVGISIRGPLDSAVPLGSWRQFQAYFGGFTGAGYLAYAVRAFFENGGQRCWVVRVASKDSLAGANPANATFRSTSGQRAWRIEASSPGLWGNQLSIQLSETHRAQTDGMANGSTPDYTRVNSVTGFERGSLVRLSQEGSPPLLRVVSLVDGVNKRMYWVHPQQNQRLPYDLPLAGLATDRPIRVDSIEYNLLVWESGRLIRAYDGLSAVPEHSRYGPSVLGPLVIAREPSQLRPHAQTPQEKRVYWAIPSGSLPLAPEPVVVCELLSVPRPVIEPLQVSTSLRLALEAGRDGLAQLTPYDLIGEEVTPWDSDDARKAKQRGLQALADVDEVSILAIPDIQIQPILPPLRAVIPPCIPDPCLPGPELAAPLPIIDAPDLPPVFSDDQVYQMQSAMVQQCEKRRDRVALVDPPFSAARRASLGIGAIQAWRTRFDTTFAAMYYPWIRVVDPLFPGSGQTRAIPPSGHVAGQCASSDLQVGVHKAPANELLAWAEDLTIAVDEAAQGILNPLGINVIRALSGRGIRIYAARTLSSDPGWKFLNVRRLLIMAEKAVDLATQWAVFEPNDAITRSKLRLSLTNFLLELWRQGGLVGDSAAEAFFVHCDESNNPPSERANGRLLAEVGVAPSYPFEFVVLRIGRTNNEFEITEA